MESDQNEDVKDWDETPDSEDRNVVISLNLVAVTNTGESVSWPFTAQFKPDCSSVSLNTNTINNKSFVAGESSAESENKNLRYRFDVAVDWQYCFADDFSNIKFFFEEDGPFTATHGCPDNNQDQIDPLIICIKEFT